MIPEDFDDFHNPLTCNARKGSPARVSKKPEKRNKSPSSTSLDKRVTNRSPARDKNRIY
jgi:hypothetical protein